MYIYPGLPHRVAAFNTASEGRTSFATDSGNTAVPDRKVRCCEDRSQCIRTYTWRGRLTGTAFELAHPMANAGWE